jgi:hypothetical protein
VQLSSRRRPRSSPPVIPAEAGIHLLCCASVFGVVAKTDSRPCAFRPPSWRPSYFLLLAQKKVTKEKAPSRPRSRGHPCPRDFASRLRGSLRAHPCALRERACLRARARVRSTRLILRLLAAAERGPGRAERGSPCRRRRGAFNQSSSSRDPAPSPHVLNRRHDLPAAAHNTLIRKPITPKTHRVYPPVLIPRPYPLAPAPTYIASSRTSDIMSTPPAKGRCDHAWPAHRRRFALRADDRPVARLGRHPFKRRPFKPE